MAATKRTITPVQAQLFAKRIVLLHASVMLVFAGCYSAWCVWRWLASVWDGANLQLPSKFSSGDMEPSKLIFSSCLLLVVTAGVLFRLPPPVHSGLLVALLIADAPSAVAALAMMRYGAGRSAPFLLSRLGWALVIALVLLTSMAWMALARIRRAKPVAGQAVASAPPEDTTAKKMQ